MTSASGFDYRQAFPVPEPATWLLLAAGVPVLLVLRRRRGAAELR